MLGVSPKGLLMRDFHHTQARLFRAQDVIDYTPLMPNDNDGPFYRAEDMQDHIRQVGRPAVDMIRNPDPRVRLLMFYLTRIAYGLIFIGLGIFIERLIQNHRS